VVSVEALSEEQLAAELALGPFGDLDLIAFGPDPAARGAHGEKIPARSTEANGMEDARFVRFVDDDNAATYDATYTAFDGAGSSQQLLATTDFRSFTSSPLLGAAANKGLALFARKVNGQFVALSRHDGEANAVAYSDDIRRGPTATPIENPTTAWEAVQVGNCGSPIETDDGWLVLTHGVGPMRTYSIGAPAPRPRPADEGHRPDPTAIADPAAR
jgi:predicted GH43/DUF377 family glycosyl hydrolase